MREPHDSGLGDLRMSDQRAFDLRSAHSVAGNVQHIIDATSDPVVAVSIAPRAIAGKVFAGKGFEVGVDEALMIAVHSAHLAGPALGNHQIAFACAF
jgi:hypothetical protein